MQSYTVPPYIGPRTGLMVPDPPSRAQGHQTRFQVKAVENKQ